MAQRPEIKAKLRGFANGNFKGIDADDDDGFQRGIVIDNDDYTHYEFASTQIFNPKIFNPNNLRKTIARGSNIVGFDLNKIGFNYKPVNFSQNNLSGIYNQNKKRISLDARKITTQNDLEQIYFMKLAMQLTMNML